MKDWFWPKSKICPTLVDQIFNDGIMKVKFREDALFVGQRHDQSFPALHIAYDIYEEYFLDVWSTDEDTRLFWTVRAMIDPFIDLMDHQNCFKVKYWMSIASNSYVEETQQYNRWDILKNF